MPGSSVVSMGFALSCALNYGVTSTSVQVALKSGRLTAMQGMIINLLTANVTLGTALAISLAVRPVSLNRNAVLYFIAAGLTAPLLARGLNYQAIRHIGATRSQSLSNAESLFAGPLAFLLVGQRVSPITAM